MAITDSFNLPEFDQLYDEHVDAVWRLLQRLGVPPSGLEDACQEVFLVAHRRRDSFRGESMVRTWLCGIAVRVAKDVRRARSRRDESEPLEHHHEVAAPQSLDEQVAQRQALQKVLSLLGQLDDDQREVLVFADFEGMTAPEISAATGVNLNTVYTRLRAARQRFNQLVQQAGGVP